MIPKKGESGFRVPKRLKGVQPTLIRQIFERALPDSINFGLGEPDLPTPDFIKAEASRVTIEEQNGYTSHAGLPALRQLVAEQYPHLDIGIPEVCVTVGSQEAMTAAFLAILEEGDEVLIPDPSFPAYENCIRISDGTPVTYRMPAETGFGFDIDEFKNKITPKTKAAVVISPSNPTGRVLTENDLKDIASVLEGTGIFLISDEIYSDLYFTSEKPRSASEFYEETLIVSGLSKSLSMTGWRLGWLAGKQTEVIKAALTIHGFLTVCTSTITQKASLLAWTEEADIAKREAREIYRRRGAFMQGLLKSELGLDATDPEGAFYTMLDVREIGDDMEAAEKCLQNRVITVPGRAFGPEAEGFLRISFCNDEDRIAEGVSRMKEALGR
ncbi:MAG: pyridoxal phosphate-dependent aminotransferase [Acidobacteria bacterium]|nr:MAG: pyridoxal phosphate-dependent aminotransferase [Acidobacteriota bacterium]REK04152.1 MAG: pyridoxal phosphate-dependent aminotransferase [Acidobacteriota bacterium]REK15314.1 MAG: pyridoxal phosphate-dependent aminotransferase [Acidobacteriota bacterium]REK46404.1 MAG: pyridoxal phosphate-dependent aminotransferase [Acidobacteriota bacterium]